MAAPQHQEGISTSVILPVQQQQQQQQQQRQSTAATSGASVINLQSLSPTPSDMPIPQEQQSTSTTPAPAAGAASFNTDGQELAAYIHVHAACKIIYIYILKYIKVRNKTMIRCLQRMRIPLNILRKVIYCLNMLMVKYEHIILTIKKKIIKKYIYIYNYQNCIT